jgi:4-hydroxy-3-methylbut-2-enyl diphosphate reductase
LAAILPQTATAVANDNNGSEINHNMARIEIDPGSGFCFGVTTAIHKAEEEIDRAGSLYCLGDIVHNSDEVGRLERKGLKIISHEDIPNLHNVKLLLRAHGEPPSTYQLAKANNIEIIDATCPVVLRLQQRIKASHDVPAEQRPQIVIYGKNGHAEVNGLVGQTDGEAIVVEGPDDLNKINPNLPVALYSQTTKSISGFREIAQMIQAMLRPGVKFESFDTICRRVANRVAQLEIFAREHDVIIFVAGEKSSNGKVLYENCLAVNPSTHLISNPSQIKSEWFTDEDLSVGICGATSTPLWLMEEARLALERLLNHCDEQAN